MFVSKCLQQRDRRESAGNLEALQLVTGVDVFEGSGFVVQAEGPVAFKAFVDNEIAKWGKTVKASGATAD